MFKGYGIKITIPKRTISEYIPDDAIAHMDKEELADYLEECAKELVHSRIDYHTEIVKLD